MVRIEKKEGRIYTTTPFNGVFVKKAKNLNGKWNGECWVFDEKVENFVKELLIEVYGTDGSYTKTITIDIDLNSYADCKSNTVWLDNLILAQRVYRDSAVKLSENTIIISGGFPSSGGSVKNPRLETYENTVLRVEIPETIYNRVKDLSGVNLVDLHENLEKELEDVEKQIKELLKRKEEILAKLKTLEERKEVDKNESY